MLQNNVIEVPTGNSVKVPVYVKIPKGSNKHLNPSPTTLSFTSSSETDASKSITVTRKIGAGNKK